jgi:AAA family ATP:ADP antiporter
MPNFKWIILLISKWGFSLFYIIAELWPNAVFALLFWQFVNKVTSIDESKRFYLLFGLLGQTGLYLSGTFLENTPKLSEYIISLYHMNSLRATVSVQLTLSVVLLLGFMALLAFWFLNHKILDVGALDIKFDIKKKSMSIVESLKMAVSSRYIRLIAILLICYGVAINLFEMPWKAKAVLLYPAADDYLAFVGGYLSYTGVVTIFFVIIGSNLVQRLGWFSAAIITPFMVFVTGMLFFATSNFEDFAGSIAASMFLSDPTTIAIVIGAITQVLSKSSKYTLFDSTKEMTYVPLDDELKTKGKAAADVIGTKLGKSASALLQSLIFIIIPSATYQSISGYLMFIFTAICLVWIWAVRELDAEYKNAVNACKTETQ